MRIIFKLYFSFNYIFVLHLPSPRHAECSLLYLYSFPSFVSLSQESFYKCNVYLILAENISIALPYLLIQCIKIESQQNNQ